jgi:ecotin
MVMKFVSVPSLIIPYNSRIPLVVYVPEGGEVRYRIWKAGETTEKAKEG